MFEQHRITRNQRGGQSIDRCHIGVVPRGNHQDHPMRDAFDHTAKSVTVFNDDIGQSISGDIGHIARALVEPAKFTTIAYGSTHLPSKFWHDGVIHRSDCGYASLHQSNTLREGTTRPNGLCRLCAAHCGICRGLA